MIMRRLVISLLLLTLAGCRAGAYEPRDGDIIFHTSRSAQSLAIQKATGSRYSHMGIVYVKDGAASVFEAVEPVKLTPLTEWIARGVGGRYVVKRLVGGGGVGVPGHSTLGRTGNRRGFRPAADFVPVAL